MTSGARRGGGPQGPRPAAAESAVPGLAVRQAAARLLGAVVEAHAPLDGLTDDAGGHPHYLALPPRDRSLLRAILRTALRFRGVIEATVAARLERRLPANAGALSHLLHVGAAQILFLDVPDHAAVDLAVRQAKADPRTRRFAPLVNAVLRGLARDREASLPQALAGAPAEPRWFGDRLETAFGSIRAGAILAMHREEPPLDLTVRRDAAGWADRLGALVLPTGTLRLVAPAADVPELPGFAEGEWWVQDAAAALPARLIGARPGLRVADLCAAPGGKTAQLAAAGANVTAVDASASRMRRLEANLARLRLAAETVVADLLAWRPAAAFDAVLLDAPCSSTGTVRRHPDVPWTKGVDDVEALAALQRRLLDRAWSWLKPGGVLVFSNCSLLPEEGEDLWRAFLTETPELVADPVAPGEIPGAEPFLADGGWLRTTPADWPDDDPRRAGLDGFFAARAKRL